VYVFVCVYVYVFVCLFVCAPNADQIQTISHKSCVHKTLTILTSQLATENTEENDCRAEIHFRTHIYIYLHIYIYVPAVIFRNQAPISSSESSTTCFMGHFPQNSPITSGSCAERDVQLKTYNASWPLCTEQDGLLI